MKPENTSRRKVLVAIATPQAAYHRGIGRYAREQDWHLVMDMAYTGVVPRDWHGDGMLISPGYNRQLSALLRSSEIPCVALAPGNDRLRVPRIEGDNLEIGRLAADHFIERGYQHLAWAPFTDDTANQERQLGFERRLAANNLHCRHLPLSHPRRKSQWVQSWRERRERLIAAIRELPRPAAIFAFNDGVAADVIDACRDAGFRVPEQIAVLGVDNEPVVCDGSPVPLSSIQHDLDAMGYGAAGMLDQLMAGNSVAPMVRRVPPQGVVIRVSTDILAVENDRVAHALRYIAENFDRPMLSVSTIAEAVGVSRRHLERMFRSELQCSINERVVQTRMQAAARLLKSHPEARMPDVAHSVGLNEPKNFFRSFRRFFQMSPNAYRAAGSPPPRLTTLPALEEESAVPFPVALEN